MSGGPTRRFVLAAGAAALALPAAEPFAWAAGRTGLHGLSTFGDLRYPADFSHFAYLNPEAPKGGRINFQPPYWFFNQAPNTFNTLNGFVLRGDAPPRIELLFDTLMASAADEPDSVYGLLAESVAVSEDRNSFTFTLREGPRFHDGTPLTAEDVAFSLMLLKEKGHPNLSQPIREMVSATAPDPKTVVVTLSGKQNRATILTVVGLPVFSKAFYTANDFERATLTPPPGSGPYRVGAVSAGRFIEYERDPDYWGRDLPVNRGSANFDRIRIDFFRERAAAFEAFKKGDITFREEFTSITWARDYNFPAVADGRVKKSLFDAEQRPSFQGLFFNTRRPKFADPRTRQAIALAFDFEWSNKNLFFDAYQRLASYFEKSDFKAEGEPTPAELALLEPYRAELPEAVFGPAYVPPKTDGSGRDRTMLRQASQLLAAAGWTRGGSGLVDASGARLTVEFLIDAEVFVRVLSPYAENLRAIGVDASIRQIDPAQYQARQNDYDFDIVLSAVSLSATPLDGLETLFGSRAADSPGTYNFSGIKEPVVDALIGKVATVGSRDELIAITRSIDRILRARHYWVPAWFQPNHRVAHWDLFGWPAEKPPYAFSPETSWWFDADRAQAAGKPNG
ncbi:ABC transporter substrate-binding protein [Prosthecomicrobium pneumaticum]|uniref:Microcin C transport system substrate-binding protein n=1 Tax=Prosthecomicrobium pneumaticum TaxID=81895 RepID=A0A7W9L211_9HYPH|nr:microcin C transport system substrate-binding protein [Prosthecomicrobium pneumaticum]